MEGREIHSGLTRGKLLKAGAAAAFAVGAGVGARALSGDGDTVPATRVAVAPTDPAASEIGPPKQSPAYLRRETYAPLVGTAFQVHRPSAPTLEMKLVEAQALAGPGDSFSLLFRGRAGVADSGGIYRLEHPALGRFDLFVSPVGRGLKGLTLQAVINRIAT